MNPSICLNMIVCNEAPVIKRCLESIKPWIDSWLITDTGSNDGTQEIIRTFMKDIPGELIEVPWVDFAHNRNVALSLAKSKAEYSLFMDADQQFIPIQGLKRINVTKECYTIRLEEDLGSSTAVYFLVRNDSDLTWKGVLHEYLTKPEASTHTDGALFQGGSILSITKDGYRSKDPDKYLKDAKVLEEALKKEPDNARYMFYLGQSYKNCNENTLALKAFEKRSKMPSSDTQETFFSLFMVGIMQEALAFDENVYLQSLFKAHEYIPSRAEPVYQIGLIYAKKKEYMKTYDLLKPYLFSFNIEDQLYIQTATHLYLLPILFCHACYHLAKYSECYEILNKIQYIEKIPEDLRLKIQQDLNHPYLKPYHAT